MRSGLARDRCGSIAPHSSASPAGSVWAASGLGVLAWSTFPFSYWPFNLCGLRCFQAITPCPCSGARGGPASMDYRSLVPAPDGSDGRRVRAGFTRWVTARPFKLAVARTAGVNSAEQVSRERQSRLSSCIWSGICLRLPSSNGFGCLRNGGGQRLLAALRPCRSSLQRPPASSVRVIEMRTDELLTHRPGSFAVLGPRSHPLSLTLKTYEG